MKSSEGSLLQLVWYAAYRDWQQVKHVFDSSFEAVCLFSLLGLVLTLLFLV